MGISGDIGPQAWVKTGSSYNITGETSPYFCRSVYIRNGVSIVEDCIRREELSHFFPYIITTFPLKKIKPVSRMENETLLKRKYAFV